MLTKKNPKMAGLVLVGTATLVLAGCSMGGSTTAAETMEPTMAPSASEESMETEAAMDPAFDNLVGAGCAMYDEAVPDGAGSIVSIDLAGGRDAARTFLDGLRLVSQMTHIGDVRTLAIHTGSTIHGKLQDGERAELGITEGLVRISVGIELVDDIVADLEQALDGVLAAGERTATRRSAAAQLEAVHP